MSLDGLERMRNPWLRSCGTGGCPSPERLSLKIIVVGAADDTATMLSLVSALDRGATVNDG
jgi:hypothetical protein